MRAAPFRGRRRAAAKEAGTGTCRKVPSSWSGVSEGRRGACARVCVNQGVIAGPVSWVSNINIGCEEKKERLGVLVQLYLKRKKRPRNGSPSCRPGHHAREGDPAGTSPHAHKQHAHTHIPAWQPIGSHPTRDNSASWSGRARDAARRSRGRTDSQFCLRESG